MTAVSWMLQEVFGARISCGSEQRHCALDEQVRLRTFGRPVMCSRSRTGGRPPSGTSAVKKRVTENVEQGGEATTAAYTSDEQRSSKR
eukprot:5272507-Pleurochrysis_carterae.AAC.2